jgi:hypothetical protein
MSANGGAFRNEASILSFLLEVPEGINTNKKIQNIGIYGMWIQAQRD